MELKKLRTVNQKLFSQDINPSAEFERLICCHILARKDLTSLEEEENDSEFLRVNNNFKIPSKKSIQLKKQTRCFPKGGMIKATAKKRSVPKSKTVNKHTFTAVQDSSHASCYKFDDNSLSEGSGNDSGSDYEENQ